MTSVATGSGSRERIVKAAILGAVAGAMAGLFGVGGGIVIVPALTMLLKMPRRLAHGTSLAAVLPVAASGLVGYWTGGEVDWAAAALLTVGAVAGALIGTRLLHVVPVRALAFGFAALLVVTAVELFLEAGHGDGRGDLTVAMVIGLLALGLFSGVLAGLLGVGGGVVMVPGMIILFGMLPAAAKGTSLAVIIPTSIAGTWRNLKAGNADLGVAAAVGALGVVSAFAVSKVSVGLDEDLSNALFALLMLAVALRMVVEQLRSKGAEAH
jgi:uncharacterized membrane protein YfcA